MIQQLLGGAEGKPPDYFAADGMHPNDKGYGVWADLIAQRLLLDFERSGVVAEGVRPR